MEGKFIVVEGISGSGKGTQARRILQHLQLLDEYADILLTPEPTRSIYGKQVRALMKQHRDQKNDPAEHVRQYLDLFLLDRQHHQKIIDENIRQGVHVIGVRYYHSTIVYQQGPSLSAEEIIARHREANIRRPDLTLILDINPENALTRVADRDEKGVHETSPKLQHSRTKYLQLPPLLPEENILVVNKGSIDEMFGSYREVLEKVLGYEKKKQIKDNEDK